jgi:nucleoside-diphosphate-sugar epimerase
MSGDGNWTIVRPCITYSKERFQFGCLEANTVCYRSFQGVPVVIPSEMLDKVTVMTWGGDVAEMLLRLILNPEAHNQDYNVATSETHTWREVYSFYAELTGMRVVETSLKDYEKIIGSHYHYQILYDRMFNRRIDNGKVLAATGLRQNDFMKLRDGLRMELEWFKHNQYYQFLNIPENARMDKYCDSQIDLSSLSDDDIKTYKEIRYGAE